MEKLRSLRAWPHALLEESLKLTGPQLFAFVATAVSMTGYEKLKDLLFPHLTLWQSHSMTIVVAALASLFCAGWAARKNLMVADAVAANSAKSMFLSTMSHEIRTPMNAILGMAELINETQLSREQHQYLEVMTSNGNALLELINGILDLARIESGRLELEQVDFDLTDLVEQTVSAFAGQAHSKGLELAALIARGVPDCLTGDALRIRQVLTNFIANAIKFTPAGEVVVEVEQDRNSKAAGDLVFSVSDTGIGIPREKLNSIFSSFTQVDTSTTRKYGGTGLGLAIAARLVKLMNGQIRVESTVGKGSKFSFNLSLGLAARHISPAPSETLCLVGYRVLVVDDTGINRLIALEAVSSCGASVSESASGAEALNAIREADNQGKPFNIVLLDKRMPNMDGIEVAQHIRAEQHPLQPLILMLSSDDLSTELAQLKAVGINSYLVKPITRRRLFEAIRSVIAGCDRGILTVPSCLAPQTGTKLELAGGARRLRILVVEDAPDNRLLMGAYLRHEPHEIEFANDGLQAVQKFTAWPYDIVFMDMRMPEMDGRDATRMIRRWEKEQRRPRAQIIALSASVLKEEVALAIAAGCDAHLAKPVRKQVLLDIIERSRVLLDSQPPVTREIDGAKLKQVA
jgi:two-component system sensor histidine kinase/response regulator